MLEHVHKGSVSLEGVEIASHQPSGFGLSGECTAVELYGRYMVLYVGM